ncbi:MAG: pyruvate kinase [Firmicutes bacterium]|nr:pyruvate kinase [Bacillota bacterium]
MRTVRIHCTIGPACNDPRILAEMIEAGMDVARVNLSHGSAESQADKLENFRKAVKRTGVQGASIMFDTRGPEIRIKDMPGGEVTLENGDVVNIRCMDDFVDGKPTEKDIFDGYYIGNILPINYEGLYKDVEVGSEVLIDDGKVRLIVESIHGKEIICHVERGGVVKSHKSVNLPDVYLNMEYLNEEDKADIIWCIENGVDYIAASFVRRKEDVEALRSFMDSNGGQKVGIIAKIESKEGVSNLEGIASIADQMLVARGDLGVEIGFEKVPAVQKRIIRKCNELGKAVIIATQLMDSMITSPVPTRAEVSDVANAVFDGATDLLVTGETASGQYPVEVIREMETIIHQAEHDLDRYGPEFL